MSRNLIQAVVVLFVATLAVAVRAQSQPDAEQPNQPAAAPSPTGRPERRSLWSSWRSCWTTPVR